MDASQTPEDLVIARLLRSADLCSRFDFSALNPCWSDEDVTAAARQPLCRSVHVHHDRGNSTFSMFIGMLFGSSIASQLHGWWPDTAPLHISLRAEPAAGAPYGFTPKIASVTRTDDGSSYDGLLRRECDSSLAWLLDAARRCVIEWMLLCSAPQCDGAASRPNIFIWIAAHVAAALKHSIGRHSCVSSRPLAAFSLVPSAIEADVDAPEHDVEQAAVDAGSHGMCLCDALAGFQVDHQMHLPCM